MPKLYMYTQDGIKKLNFNIKNEISPNSIKIEQTYIGINKFDIRNNQYKNYILGTEGVGIIKQIGQNVKNFKIGERVGYCMSITGSYCTERIIDQKLLYKIPNNITDVMAASIMFKGVMAYYLTRKIFFTCPKSFIVSYCSTGGIGYIICQMLKIIDAIVIGTSSAKNKIDSSKKYNLCNFYINNEDIEKYVIEITNGIGAVAIFDPIGESIYNTSLKIISKKGTIINYGNTSGTIKNIRHEDLFSKSIYLSCPNIMHYTNTQEVAQIIKIIFTLIVQKKIYPIVNFIGEFDDIPDIISKMKNNKLMYSNIVKV